MRALLSKAEIESDIAGRFENAFRLQEKKVALTLAAELSRSIV
jgi:hypothetical protein